MATKNAAKKFTKKASIKKANADTVDDTEPDFDEIDPANIVSTNNDELDAMWDDEEDEEPSQTRKAHLAPSMVMLKEAEKLAAQAERAHEKVKRQKDKEARSPRKALPAPSVAMLKDAEKLSNQAFKLREKAKKQEAKEAVAAAAADAKESAEYVVQLEKELVKAKAAAKKSSAKLEKVQTKYGLCR